MLLVACSSSFSLFTERRYMKRGGNRSGKCGCIINFDRLVHLPIPECLLGISRQSLFHVRERKFISFLQLHLVDDSHRRFNLLTQSFEGAQFKESHCYTVPDGFQLLQYEQTLRMCQEMFIKIVCRRACGNIDKVLNRYVNSVKSKL